MQVIVETAWMKAKSRGLVGIRDCIAAVHQDLHAWDRKELKRPKHRINKFRKELEGLRRGPTSS